MTSKEKVPFHISLPAESYWQFNAAAASQLGGSFAELATTDPHEAYRLLRLAAFSMFMTAQSDSIDVVFESGVRVTSRDDGYQATSGAFSTMLQDGFPSVPTEPIEVVVSTISEPENPGKEVLRFTVEPPDFAF